MLGRQTSSICLQTGTLKGKGFRILPRNYGKMQAACSEAADTFQPVPDGRLAPTHPTSSSCFPSLACLPPPLPAQGLQRPYQAFPHYSVTHTFQGPLGEHLEARAIWKSRQCGSQGAGQLVIHKGMGAGKEHAFGEFPSVQLCLLCIFPPLIQFVGLRTSSVLLTFHSHAEC